MGPRALVRSGDEEVSLVSKPEIHPLLHLIEEVDAFTDERHLIRVVELQPKGTSRDRRGERRQCGAFFQDDRLQAGPLGEEGGGAPDDAAADNDEVGALGR